MAAGSVGRHSPRSTPPRHGPTALPRRASADMPGSTGNSAAGWSVPRPALRGQTRKRRALFCRVARWAAAAFSPNPARTIPPRSLQWAANIGARAGYLLTPQWLLYGTAGFGLQQIETTGACISPSLNSQYCFGPGPQPPIRHGLTFLGVTVGSGVETQLAPNWLLRGEYRFSYFPEASDTLAFLPSTTGLNNTYRYRLSAQTHILSVGLAYKF